MKIIFDKKSKMIKLILGPMFAEKSTNLLRNYRRMKIAKKECILIKYEQDQRYTKENYIATHDHQFSTDLALPCQKLFDLDKNNLEKYDVICIDEIQFYQDAIEFCIHWRARGKIMIASGLYADFKRKPFPRMGELIAVSDQIEFLNAICHDCSQDSATTSYRISNESDQVVVGGSDKYIPLCQTCYEAK